MCALTASRCTSWFIIARCACVHRRPSWDITYDSDDDDFIDTHPRTLPLPRPPTTAWKTPRAPLPTPSAPRTLITAPIKDDSDDDFVDTPRRKMHHPRPPPTTWKAPRPPVPTPSVPRTLSTAPNNAGACLLTLCTVYGAHLALMLLVCATLFCATLLQAS